MRTPHPIVTGTVKEWHDEDGWGVLRTPDGIEVWCHYSAIQISDPTTYKTLRVDEVVAFDYETPGQDGCSARVLSFVRRGG